MGIKTGILSNREERSLHGIFNNAHAGVVRFDIFAEIEQSDTTAGDDTLGEGGLRGGDSVVNAEFFLIDFGLGGTADFDDGDFTLERSSAFFELAFFIVRGGIFGL